MMNYTKLLFLTGLLILCVSPVMGWNVDAPGHSGTIVFNGDNTGNLNVDGYALTFDWKEVSENTYVATYLWYSVKFNYNNDGTVTSPQFPGARLVR
jgi:hypothetical protein